MCLILFPKDVDIVSAITFLQHYTDSKEALRVLKHAHANYKGRGFYIREKGYDFWVFGSKDFFDENYETTCETVIEYEKNTEKIFIGELR